MRRSPRPVIGINVDLVSIAKTGFLQVPSSFAEILQNHGALPVIMPLLGRDAEISQFLDRVDGFALLGGEPLDPRMCGGTKHPKVKPMNVRREEHDRMLIHQLLERRMPILATGVGSHLLTVATGGSLYTFLPEEMPRALPHLDVTCSEAHRHRVQFVPGSRMAEIYGCLDSRVNSHHHQAIRKLGDGFRASAHAPDGVIEAIEAEDGDWFCFGVQWQPEAESACALDLQLFDGFVNACRATPSVLSMAA